MASRSLPQLLDVFESLITNHTFPAGTGKELGRDSLGEVAKTRNFFIRQAVSLAESFEIFGIQHISLRSYTIP